MKVLFITRKYPPRIGGMEKYSKGLIDNVNCQKRIIALKRSQWNLFWFIPYSIIKGFFMSKDCDLIYFCDSFMAMAGSILKFLTKKPVLITAHGLDVTYSNPLYQLIIIRLLKYLDRVICVSNSTIDECVKRKVDRKKCVFIPNGISFDESKIFNSLLSANFRESAKGLYKKYLYQYCGKKMKRRKALITVGRLVKRKGVAWFVKNVMPKLDESIDYIIIGEGKEKSRIKEIVKKNKLEQRVFLLGRLSNVELRRVCYAADLFVMPNIRIKGDMEGFGIVALEASNWALPLVASDLEGIRDAVIDKKNGVLVSSMDEKAFRKEINKFLNDSERARLFAKQAFEYNKKHFAWDKVCGKYLSLFEDVVKISSKSL